MLRAMTHCTRRRSEYPAGNTQNAIGLNFEFCESTIPLPRGHPTGQPVRQPPCLLVPLWRALAGRALDIGFIAHFW
jgi:hypothetical protein